MEPLINRVMKLLAKHDDHLSLFWSEDLRLFINCNDVFFWGTSDLQEITEQNFQTLEAAYANSSAHGALLFCAHIRCMRPQGAAYPPADSVEGKLVVEMLNHCGPVRELNTLNPYASFEDYDSKRPRRKEPRP